MKHVENVILLFSPTVQLANNFGPIIFGIWLAILGHWMLIVLGLLAVIAYSIVLKYALLLQLFLTMPINYFAHKGFKSPIYILVFLSQSYAAALMAIWCLIVFSYSLQLSPSTNDALIPVLGWSYGVALAPWTYLVMHEIASSGEPPSSFILMFFACVGYIAMVLIFLFGGELILARSTFLVLTIVGLISQYLSSLNEVGTLLKKVPNY